MKKLIIICLALVASVGIYAEVVKIMGVWYEIYPNSEYAIVTFQPKKDKWQYVYNVDNKDYVGTVTIPSSVVYEGKKYRVEGIGAHAFDNCRKLKRVNIPNSVHVILYRAFGECENLKYVKVPESVVLIDNGAFSQCYSLMHLELPDSIPLKGTELWGVPNVIYHGTDTTAPWGACSLNGYIEGPFVYNDKTKTTLLRCTTDAKGKITIPKTVARIEEGAFAGCNKISSVIVPNSVKYIGEYAFSGCAEMTDIILPEGLERIEDGTFYSCDWLTSITIPSSVTSIGEGAFRYCSSLEHITIPKNVKQIKQQTFEYTIFLKEITLPEDLEEIGQEAFRRSGIEQIVIPDGVQQIEYGTFASCGKLKDVTLPAHLNRIETCAFSECCKLSDVTFPQSLQEIGDSAFYGCFNLEKIDIPDSVTRIGQSAFSYCSRLKEVTLPSHIRTIEPYVLMGDVSLRSMTIPTSVDSIKEGALAYCGRLTNVEVPSSVNYIGDYAFWSIDKIIYHGDTTGTPWGAGVHNEGFYEGMYLFEDSTKSVLVRCLDTLVTHAEMPSSVTVIYPFAFAACSNLQSVDIPNSVTYIGDFAFDLCKRISSLQVPANVERIGVSAFYGVLNVNYSGSLKIFEASAKAVNKYVESPFAFEDSTKSDLAACAAYPMEKVVVPSSVHTVSWEAFSNCRIDTLILPKCWLASDDVFRYYRGKYIVCEDVSSMVHKHYDRFLYSLVYWFENFHDPQATTVVVPDVVQKKAPKAFKEMQSRFPIMTMTQFTTLKEK